MEETVQVRALYDFEAQGTGELSIWADEILTITRRDIGEGWWEGTNARGESGLFPAGYVELVSSSGPPSIPPPPPPPISDNETAHTQSLRNVPQQPQQQQSYDNDDWDDDWDDDDDSIQSSQDYHQQQQLSGSGPFGLSAPNRNNQSYLDVGSKGDASGKQTVKRFNRFLYSEFSTFVKLGGEAFLLGTTKVVAPPSECVTILDYDGEIMWTPTPEPYYCEISSPKKESKLKGLKSFIAYQITPSFNNIQVSRRYKHFDWLHERLQDKFTLIPIPPLPDKQISGRYQEEFIEHRMAQLQLWVNRMCRHPVVSQCDVWKHFLTCTDDKKWKLGKRKAEKDELSGAEFFIAIQSPGTPLDPAHIERVNDNFGKFSTKMDESVKQLSATTTDQMKKCAGAYRREFMKVASSFRDVALSFELEPLFPDLTKAIKHTGDTFENVGKMYDDKLRHSWANMADVLHEYKGILACWPDILSIHKGFLNKKKEYQKFRDEGKLTQEDLDGITSRTDVVNYAMLAEVTHFQQERVGDFKNMMHNFLTSQIEFYEEVVQNLKETRQHYES